MRPGPENRKDLRLFEQMKYINILFLIRFIKNDGTIHGFELNGLKNGIRVYSGLNDTSLVVAEEHVEPFVKEFIDDGYTNERDGRTEKDLAVLESFYSHKEMDEWVIIFGEKAEKLTCPYAPTLTKDMSFLVIPPGKAKSTRDIEKDILKNEM